MDGTNARKKIIFICTGVSEGMFSNSASGITGGDVRLAEIMNGAVLAGLQVHLLVWSGAALFCDNFNLEGVICHNLNFGKEIRGRFGFIVLTFKLLFLSLPEVFAKFDNAIVYSANELLWDVIPSLKIKIKNTNVKWAAVVHWLPPLKFWSRRSSSWFNSFMFLVSERLSVFLIKHFADAVLAVSNSTMRQLHDLNVKKEKLFQVDCGVDFSKIEHVISDVQEKEFEAVFLKRIQAVKGVFDLVDIWEAVIVKKPTARLAIIGGGADAVKLQNMIELRGLEENIKFFGEILDFKRKFEILAQSKMFVLPSYEENWAIVVGEAMATGLPVLAYELNELQEVWGDSFHGIPVGDTAQFAKDILDYLDNDEKREILAKRGHNYVRQYDWLYIAEEEVNLIKSL